MSAGRSLELFFIDGRPDGMLTAEVFNWTGHVLRAPRTQLPQAIKRRLHGKAVLRDGEMVILAGSQVRDRWAGNPAHTPGSARRHAELVAQGIIDSSVSPAIFTTDFAFASPSLAAEMVAGRSSNGRVSWIHTTTGQTYAEWEAAQLEQDTP